MLVYLSNLFPLLHAVLIIAISVVWIRHPKLEWLLLLLFSIYLLPPLLWRLYCLRYPVREGLWVMTPSFRNDWWVSFQLQLLYSGIPFFEVFLRLVPGLYSQWLRLWGSKIGKNTYWTPSVEILDRHMLRLGDNVVFGHRSICTSHIITRKPNGDLLLLLRRIEIGDNVLIGGESRIGPGVKIPDNAPVPYRSLFRFRYRPPSASPADS